MPADKPQPPAKKPEDLILEVIELCTACDQCRDLMDGTSCLFFPKLYRMYDRQMAGKGKITSRDMQSLVNLCNMCGLCSCAQVRTKIREGKDGFIRRDGQKLLNRLLKDVRLVGRIGGAFPRLANFLFQKKPFAGLCRRMVGMHPDRKVPVFPRESFATWANARNLHVMTDGPGPKVAYFIGCSATYLFPEVAKATVEVLQRNGISVYIPEQKCCGVPGMLEGDRDYAFSKAGFNLTRLMACIDKGYDIVCSCPTCGYMLKSVLRDGAHMSEQYVATLKTMLAEEDGDMTRLCRRVTEEEAASDRPGKGGGRAKRNLALPLILSGQTRDDGYFAALDPHARMEISRHTYDLAEYLRILNLAGKLDTRLAEVPGRMVYYPPCHLKEQDMGQPWTEILGLVPGMDMPTIGGAFDCCGSAGIRGFRKGFHKASLAQGRPLMDKMRAADPERIATDCISCRLQFNQMLPTPVSHPVELLRAAYRAADGSDDKDAK